MSRVRLSRFRWLLVNALLAAFVVGLMPNMVALGNGVGTALKLGVNNTVNAITKLTATTSAAAMLIKNSGTGTGLDIQVGAGKAPITVSAGAGKATNLDADKLDGKDSTTFQNKLTNLTDLNGIGCGADGMLLATTAIECIRENWEPNDTPGTATILYNPFNTSGFAGGGDVDWYVLDSPVCGTFPGGGGATGCLVSVSLNAVNVRLDVYVNGSPKYTNVKSYQNFDVYTGSPPTYTIRVFSTNKEPYKINRDQ